MIVLQCIKTTFLSQISRQLYTKSHFLQEDVIENKVLFYRFSLVSLEKKKKKKEMQPSGL